MLSARVVGAQGFNSAPEILFSVCCCLPYAACTVRPTQTNAELPGFMIVRMQVFAHTTRSRLPLISRPGWAADVGWIIELWRLRNKSASFGFVGFPAEIFLVQATSPDLSLAQVSNRSVSHSKYPTAEMRAACGPLDDVRCSETWMGEKLAPFCHRAKLVIFPLDSFTAGCGRMLVICAVRLMTSATPAHPGRRELRLHSRRSSDDRPLGKSSPLRRPAAYLLCTLTLYYFVHVYYAVHPQNCRYNL